jgi:selenocysteine lyase/cysteine desulfurase
MNVILRYEAALTRRFLSGFAEIPAGRLYGIADPGRVSDRTPTFAVRLGGRPPQEIAAALGEAGIFVWDGNYYALEIMERLGLEPTGGAVRVGFCHYNTREEVDRVLAALEREARRSP